LVPGGGPFWRCPVFFGGGAGAGCVRMGGLPVLQMLVFRSARVGPFLWLGCWPRFCGAAGPGVGRSACWVGCGLGRCGWIGAPGPGLVRGGAVAGASCGCGTIRVSAVRVWAGGRGLCHSGALSPAPAGAGALRCVLLSLGRGGAPLAGGAGRRAGRCVCPPLEVPCFRGSGGCFLAVRPASAAVLSRLGFRRGGVRAAVCLVGRWCGGGVGLGGGGEKAKWV